MQHKHADFERRKTERTMAKKLAGKKIEKPLILKMARRGKWRKNGLVQLGVEFAADHI
ncbi:MAG: hypothetical protein WCO56_08770 [Verrucomicrobiota bacterium]